MDGLENRVLETWYARTLGSTLDHFRINRSCLKGSAGFAISHTIPGGFKPASTVVFGSTKHRLSGTRSLVGPVGAAYV